MLTIGKSTMLGAAFLAGVAIAACQQPPGPQIAALPPANGPPANAAPAPDRETPQQNPSRPIPQQPSIGHDGSYAGSMTEMASGLGGHPTTACVPRTPVSMRIERDNVTISYNDWNGRTIQYRGKVDPAGGLMRGIRTMTEPALFSLARSEIMSFPGICSAITAITH